MQPRAVIYCSKHGATKEYAQCLGKKKNLPVFSIDHISGYSFQNIPVYFCGWIRNLSLTTLEKMYVDVFQPSLMGKNRGETHEYSI